MSNINHLYEARVTELGCGHDRHGGEWLHITAKDDAGMELKWRVSPTTASQYRIGARVRVHVNVSLDHLSPEVTLTEWALLMLARETQTDELREDKRVLSELGVPDSDHAKAYILFERCPPNISAMLVIERECDRQEWMKEKQISYRDVPLDGTLLRAFRELAGEARKDFNLENGDRYIELESESDPDPAPVDPVDDMPF